MPDRRSVLALGACLPVLAVAPAWAAPAKPSRVGMTTVSLRERYPLRQTAKGVTTQGHSLLEAPGYIVRNLGIRSIELWSLQFEALSLDYARQMRSAADKAGARIINIQVDDGINLASTDEQVRRTAITTMQQWVDRAVILGAPAVRANMGSFRSDEPFSMEHCIASFRELATYGAAHGVLTLVENHLGISGDVTKVAQLLRGVDHPSCRAIIDWGNSRASSTEALIDMLGLLAPWLYLISAKGMAFDSAYRETSYDVPSLVRAAEGWGFRGLYSIELFGETPEGFDPLKAARAMENAITVNLDHRRH